MPRGLSSRSRQAHGSDPEKFGAIVGSSVGLPVYVSRVVEDPPACSVQVQGHMFLISVLVFESVEPVKDISLD